MSYLGTKPSNQTPSYKQVYEYTATSGQTSFTAPYTPGFVEVYRNGVKLGSSDFTATTGTTVVLASGASAGDFVQVVSLFINATMSAIPNTAGAVATANIADGNVTQAKLAAGVVGNGPAFRASTGYTNNIAAVTNVVLSGFTTVFDTASCFNTSTSRFTPNVAGYYQITASVDFGAYGINAAVSIDAQIYKNGSVYSYAGCATSGGTFPCVQVTDIVYLNGTTDYVTAGAYHNANATATGAKGVFSGVLVRAA